MCMSGAGHHADDTRGFRHHRNNMHIHRERERDIERGERSMEWLRALYGSMMRRKRTPSRFSVTLSVRVAHIDPSVRRAHLIHTYIHTAHIHGLSLSLSPTLGSDTHTAHTHYICSCQRACLTHQAHLHGLPLCLSLSPSYFAL
jgi:hypothetical protein